MKLQIIAVVALVVCCVQGGSIFGNGLSKLQSSFGKGRRLPPVLNLRDNEVVSSLATTLSLRMESFGKIVGKFNFIDKGLPFALQVSYHIHVAQAIGKSNSK